MGYDDYNKKLNRKFEMIDKIDKIKEKIGEIIKVIIKVLALLIFVGAFYSTISGDQEPLYFIMLLVVIIGIETWHSEQNKINKNDRDKLLRKLKECQKGNKGKKYDQN
jgi:hypothetical protein